MKRGSTLPFADAERVLAGPSSGLPPIVLAAGAEDYLRDRLVAAFRAGGEAEGAESLRLEGDDLDAEGLAGALASMSLFASLRRIWIREASKLDKACDETLLAWADASGEGARVLVTTARDPSELRVLQAIAARGASVACDVRAADVERWVGRMLAEAGVKLPAAGVEAIRIAAVSGGLLAAKQEVEKLRAASDAEGRVPAAAAGALRASPAGASLDRWADALLAGDLGGARREAAALDAEGVSGTNSLWAVAERALAALEPQSFGWRRGAAAGPRLGPRSARAALDAVYAADRALKRGEIRDVEIREMLEQRMRGAVNA